MPPCALSSPRDGVWRLGGRRGHLIGRRGEKQELRWVVGAAEEEQQAGLLCLCVGLLASVMSPCVIGRVEGGASLVGLSRGLRTPRNLQVTLSTLLCS